MKNAVIVHGWGATSKSNWFPWLAEELKKVGFKVTVPDFPNTEHPILSEWLHHFRQMVSVDENTILIGHSLGVPFILRFLEQCPKEKNIKAAFLVAGFDHSLGIAEIDNFVDKSFDWKKIKSSSKLFFVINSDNDPYIPLPIGENLAKKLNTNLIVEHNAGHINDPSGFLSYPHLPQLILSLEQ